jgi:pyrroloquinoline quinone (PQQ) biosynthesis protein C
LNPENEQLRQTIVEKITKLRWKGHPWFKKFFAGALKREHVQFWHEQQFYVTGYANELIAPLYIKCTDSAVRVKILNNLLEEETGCETKTAAHHELFIRLGLALGNTRERYADIRPIAETAALRHYWDWLVKERPFIEGLAGVAVSGEGQMPGMGSKVAQALQEQFNLTHDQVAAWWAHDEADAEHSGSALAALCTLVKTDAERKAVTRAVDLSLELMWLFLSGLHRVCVEDRPLP